MSDSVTPKQYAAERQAIIIKTITELRERHKLSQRDLADLLGCSPSRIARLKVTATANMGWGNWNFWPCVLDKSRPNSCTYPPRIEAG